jgi:hypothetical protein
MSFLYISPERPPCVNKDQWIYIYIYIYIYGESFRVFFHSFSLAKPLTREHVRGKYRCTIDLLFDWFGISYMTPDNFCFYLLNRLIQTSQTGGQWYSDTSPFSIPCFVLQYIHISVSLVYMYIFTINKYCHMTVVMNDTRGLHYTTCFVRNCCRNVKSWCVCHFLSLLPLSNICRQS